MLVLGIETSCDDTGLALVRDGKMIDHIVSSQTGVHAIFGGVVPELASREHGRNIGPIFDALLSRNSLAPAAIDLVAVTRGPGLAGSLLVGVAFAKSLCLSLGRKLIGINHLHAHLLAAGIGQKLPFPAIGLVASGGHTDLYLMEAPWQIIRLGRTMDDAVGETFDKAGAAIGLSYPAGKAIDDLGRMGNPAAYELPCPYLANDNLDFSFSGLKTAALRLAHETGLQKNSPDPAKADFCACLNNTIAITLEEKCKRALKKFPHARALVISGGAAANSMIRERLSALSARRGVEFRAPTPALCQDNGAMIAHAGYLLGLRGCFHNLELEAIPRGRAIPDDMLGLSGQ